MRRRFLNNINKSISGDYHSKYFTIEALEDGLTAKLSVNACEYRIDDGSWNTLSAGSSTQSINTGHTLSFKGNLIPDSSTGSGTFTISKKCNLKGNVMSLLYGDEFSDKTSLTGRVFYRLFKDASTIIDSRELIIPATTVDEACYAYMFENCTNLKYAPKILPAETLQVSCYYHMFRNCTNLIEPPKILANVLASSCFVGMFRECTSLEKAYDLTATVIQNATNCCSSMFYGCTALTTAPKLPVTQSCALGCYQRMFEGCTSLTTSPELPAATLATGCYLYMFYGCSKLNKITMLATNISASNCLNSWVYGVASTGVFVKHPDVTSLPTGTSGVPSGWEIVDPITITECASLTITADDVLGNDTTTSIHYTAICNGIDYKGETITGIIEEGTVVSSEFPQNTSETETVERTITFEFMGVTATTTITQGVWLSAEQQYLTFEAIQDSTFKLTKNACQYSLDSGNTWVSLSANTNTPIVPAGRKILFKITNPTIGTNSGVEGMGTFSSTGKFNVSGNIMSILYGDDFVDKNDLTRKDYAFYKLFSGSKVVEAHRLILPATTLAASFCYQHMFNSCYSLTTAPQLPATTLAYYCYSYMFRDCTSLTIAPELPATTLSESCYADMFRGCSKLTTAPELPVTTLASQCYNGMFYGCKGLTEAPELPATTLKSSCYKNMFRDCTSLTIAPELPATVLADYCYANMFYNCTSLNNIVMLATNTSALSCLDNWVNGVSGTGTFVKHIDMTSLPTGTSGVPNGWTIKDNFTPTECISLTITADNVSGRETNTTIYYTAIVNGTIVTTGEYITNKTITGTTVSENFPQNKSETEEVTRTVSYTYVGVTATTTITQGVWVSTSYTIDLNSNWQLSTGISNPDSSTYDGVYESYSNKGVHNTAAVMYIDINGYENFNLYIRSYAESNYDYVMVSQLDASITNDTSYSDTSLVKAHTRGSQTPNTAISGYTLVEFTGIDGGEHRITVLYRKDVSASSGDDRGYLLIPKNQ